MSDYAFAAAPVVSLLSMSTKPFPVRRIYCVGQNYKDHAKEMGAKLYLPPMTMEGVGRMAVIADPQGAVFAIFKSAR